MSRGNESAQHNSDDSETNFVRENWMTKLFIISRLCRPINSSEELEKITYLLQDSLILGFFHDKVCFLLFFWLFGEAAREEVGVDGVERNEDSV